MTYIYTLTDPRNNQIRYVGKADNPKNRLSKHIYDARKKNRNRIHRWINLLVSNNLRPELRIIEECPEENWQEREIYWIAYYRNFYDLTNATNGGDGIRPTPETREKMKLAQKGRIVTEETKQLLSSINKGHWVGEKNPNYRGKHFQNNHPMKGKVQRGIKFKNSSSKFIGVSFSKKDKLWISRVNNFNGKTKYIGWYKDEIEAAKAYDDFVIFNDIQSPLNFK